MGLHPGITYSSLHRQESIPDSRIRGHGRPLGRVLGMTKGMAGVVNDKSIVRFDKTLQAVREVEPYRSMAYQLRDKDGVEQVEKGLYLIVDGAYHRWMSLVCPAKEATTREELAWSKRLESVRKDVECFFGILKNRFRILKLPIIFRESA